MIIMIKGGRRREGQYSMNRYTVQVVIIQAIPHTAHTSGLSLPFTRSSDSTSM